MTTPTYNFDTSLSNPHLIENIITNWDLDTSSEPSAAYLARQQEWDRLIKRYHTEHRGEVIVEYNPYRNRSLIRSDGRWGLRTYPGATFTWWFSGDDAEAKARVAYKKVGTP